MGRKNFFLLRSIAAASFLFFLPAFVWAQDEQGAPAEVLLDEAVTTEDLGAYTARILPDSPWHAFKRFGWQIQEALTFDPVRDAALKHDHAMQQLSEVKQLVNEKGISNVAPEVMEKTMERFQNSLAEVTDAADDLHDERETNLSGVDSFME